jgi:GntP family gluconate:H+ symporter
MPATSSPAPLLFYTAVAVLALVTLIARFKIPAFVSLTLASLFVGICSGMSLLKVVQSFQAGMGTMLGAIGAVVGLGMIIGKLLAESGGAQIIATTLTRALGERQLPWTLMLVGLVVGIPVFFTVGVVLLTPILLSLLKETRQPLLVLGIPLLAGLSVVHGLVPPHPGPMAAIGLLHADTGRTILYAFAVGLPTAALAGPVLGWLIGRRALTHSGVPVAGKVLSAPPGGRPGFGLTLFTILLPVLLMLSATVADLTGPAESSLRTWIDFFGNPVVAMLAATLFSLYSFGIRRGFDREQLMRLSEDCLAPAGAILLVVGAGGGFNRVLLDCGVGSAITSVARSLSISPLLLGWVIAALIRISTGSATVAITTATGIVAPFAASLPGTNRELLVVATGAGSLVLSHVNDGGFWFVKEYLGLSVMETLQSWTVMETVIGLVALGLTLLLNLF